ncbi:mRNA cleavage factor-like protein, putative [Plasmodium gallinaceum]|uniref:Cleavage and polyadenylation specificity factor subunit 5 n=1 Tax=Plasmodium gallinaceum TaxID=5849 RepID=A0A1J1GLT7_PLAGA|nr:mRNA cleavage factor-like protein, putative [Plasmodium gallinaceum]CRG93345.1 mRNA cleavage factor-like protein, putative [Plasmodium gallinaceum]
MVIQSTNSNINTTNINICNRENKSEWLLYPQSNYEFNIDEKLKNKFIIDNEKCKKRINSYNKNGIRNSVLAIILCHRYEYPHLLLLQHLESQKYYLLNGKYKTWEKPKEVLKKKLQKYINKIKDIHFITNQINSEKEETVEIGEFLGEWWKTQFNSVYLPYLPAHVTRPKEYVRLYQVTLSSKCIFHLPPGFTLKALPLFDLNNCGLAINGLSSILSRFKLHCMVQEESEN